MRKFVAMTMVALLALTLALVVVGCGQTAEETTTTPAETSMPPAETAMPESAMADTSMGR
jgi:PBP1b-binding outer membrane lipoprotein LpoB